MKLNAFVLMIALVANVATPAFAWDWRLLGTRDVRDAVDHDVFALDGSLRFDRIKLCVFERPVHFIDLDVRFANGGHQDVPVRARIQPGQCTRAIDLQGAERNITSVNVVYEANTPRRGVHASVRLYGE